MSTRGLRKRIQAQCQTALQDVVSRLADNPSADVTEHLRRLKTYTEVLVFLQPRVRPSSPCVRRLLVLALPGSSGDSQ
jgi:hypothetical protein